jgi:hypothetical protein
VNEIEDYEWLVGKDMEGGNQRLFGNTLLAFAWGDRKTSVTRICNPARV